MDATEAHSRRTEVQILDVREAREWQAGRIDGSVHVPLSQVTAHLDRLDRDRPIVAVCRSGNRSGVATALLRANGFTAENLDGGLRQWARAGYPLSAQDGSPGRVV